MSLYQQGDFAAFEELYHRHAGRVQAYLARRLPAGQDVADVLQVVFLKLHQSRDRYDAKFPFLPWLFTITHHALVDRVRRRQELPVAPEVLARQEIVAPEDSARELESDLAAAIAALPADSRDLLRLRFQEGMSFESIARQLGMTPVGVRKRVSRLFKTLRRLVGPKEGGVT